MTLIILMYALFATSFPISKVLLGQATPLFLTGVRMFGAGAILLGYQYFVAHDHFRFRKRHIWLYLQLMISGIYLTYLLRFWALGYLSSSKTAFFYTMSPFFSAVYSYFVFKEKLTKKQLFGLLVGFLGLIPILLTSTPAETRLGEWYFVSWHEAALLASVALHSYSWVVLRKLVRDKSYSPSMVNGISMFGGGLLALLSSFLWDGTPMLKEPLTFFGWLGAVILVCNIICHNMYGYLLKKYTATFISFVGFVSPLFTALYGWGLLNEKITWHFFASTLIVGTGLYLFYKDELGRYHAFLEE